jgi:L-fucose isomerase-like protein
MGGMTRVGLVTFDFPPQYRRADLAGRPTATGSKLAARLAEGGVEVLAPAAELAQRDPGAAGGIRDLRDLAFCLDRLRSGRVQCLVIEVFHWARLSLVTRLVEDLALPVAVYAVVDEGWNGVPCSSAIAGGLREMPRSRPAALVELFLGPETGELLRWIAGASALIRMRASRIMLWGGGYGAEMSYSRGDPAAVEARFIGEVMSEQEEVLTRAARTIIDRAPGRIEAFLAWLGDCGARVERDGRMVTDASLAFQVALYLAARDRIAELGAGDPEGGNSLIGASIKCHYEMSISCTGCTACFLPAFLPFGSDPEGRRDILPTVCEGDLNGLLGLVMLHQLAPSVPPLFGDLVAYRPDHVLMRNCGASSVYWAGLSMDPALSLAATRIRPNLHGASGAAVGYETPACPEVTFARLFRQDGRFAMLVGEGRVLPEGPDSRYDDPWPHTRLDLGMDGGLLFKAMPCNHGSLGRGLLGREIEVFCSQAGIPVFRCDDAAGLRELVLSRGGSTRGD